jgi:PAS domain S-box-containing protein
MPVSTTTILSPGAGERAAPGDGAGRGDAPELLEATFASMAEGVVVYGPGGEMLRMNAAAERIFGFSQAEWAAAGPEARAALLHIETPDGRPFPPGEAPTRKALRGEPSRDVEMVLSRRGGERAWVRASSAPIRGRSGEIRGAVAILSDVTDQRRAERAMRDSEELYRSLFTLAPSGVVLNDEDGEILAFNDIAHEQLGYTRAEFAELLLSDVDANEKPVDVRRHIADILSAGGAEYEVQHRTKSGEVRHVLVQTRPVEMGGRLRFLNVWQDITQRKRAEDALREADRRKTEFLAMLSHELRNPLAPIRNSIYLLERAAPGSEQAARAKEVVRRQAEHLTRLVDDLLDVTRVSRGLVDLHRVRLDLRDVVRRTADDLHSVFEQSGVALRLDHAFAPVWVEADSTRLAQVVGNLLHNAVKFTPSGGEVTVGVAAAAGQAELYVRDNGMGMEPGTIERMFEPFVQAEQNLARSKGGLGLGLALVKCLVELHGGRVRARSEGPGRGAEFVVSLPSCSDRATSAEDRSEARPVEGRVVLVVEDNVDAATSLAEILELHGHRVRVARDGVSGIELARELRPDVVLCDIGLPDVDGYEVARTLRREEALRSTRLVALSGYAQPEDRRRARDAGFDAHMAKPPDVDELMRALAGGGERTRG